MPENSIAPWTSDEVRSLNDFQSARVMHPFTCGNDSCRAVLHATPEGWTCPDCDYRQDWAHLWMADGTWREVFGEHRFAGHPKYGEYLKLKAERA